MYIHCAEKVAHGFSIFLLCQVKIPDKKNTTCLSFGKNINKPLVHFYRPLSAWNSPANLEDKFSSSTNFFPESYRSAANSLGKGMPLHSNKFESDALFKKVLNIFLLFLQYLHLEILMALHLNYFKSTSPKGALC